MTLVAIRSVASPDHFICVDANGLTSFTATGGGQVKTPTYVDSFETFLLQRNDDGTVSFKSTFSKDLYIRLDVSLVTPGEMIPSGGGTVNCQLTAHSWEKFRIHKKDREWHQYKGVVGIESATFPGRFLRMDVASGVVNVQGVMRSLEEVEILVVG